MTAAAPANARTDARRRVVLGVLLALLGFGLGWIFRDPLLHALRQVFPPSEATWDEWVREDATTLLGVVGPDPRLPEELPQEFLDHWDRRRRRYPPERLTDLRRRLDDYLDFLEAEHSDCAEIYRAGIRENVLSDAAKEARRRVTADFGPFAETLIRQADALRDEAYLASPKTAGFDPDATNFVESREDLRNWMPRARARVIQLTTIP